MQRSVRDLLFIVLGLFVSVGLVWAARGDSAVRLASDISYLNTLGRRAANAQILDRSIMAVFKTTQARIRALRGAGMGEGDIAAALAAASRLSGGLSDASVSRVLKFWKTERAVGWAGILKALGVSADRVALAVERVRRAPAAQGRSAAATHTPAPGSLLVSGTTLAAP